MTFDLDTYLARVRIDHPGSGAEGLARLLAAQMTSIPFENIDPLLGRLPGLDPGSVWTKLVLDGRGGYCMELNGLLGQALAALGFEARPILGRVRMGEPQGGPRAHLAWVVSIDGRQWLADCGFGGPAPRTPIALQPVEQFDGSTRFRIHPDLDTGEQVLERATADGWFSLYGFDDVTPWPVDIAAANVVCSRWEQAPFPDNLLMTRLTPVGRVSLFNREGKTETHGAVDAWRVDSASDLEARLTIDFGLRLDAAEILRVWERLKTRGEQVETYPAEEVAPVRTTSAVQSGYGSFATI